MTVPPRSRSPLPRAAAAEGLLDVGYDVVESPIGPLLVAATARGLVPHLLRRRARAAARAARAGYGPRVLRSAASVDSAHRQLDEYFAGRRSAFELDVDLRGVRAVRHQVLDELARVPYGQTTTYGTLAAKVGAPRRPGRSGR